MLTIFSTPKPFRGHFGVIQRNAITSWAVLRPQVEVILFGDAEGTEEICRDLGIRHIREAVCTARGTPLLSDLFRQASVLSPNEIHCFVNADIILFQSLLGTVRAVQKEMPQFLIIAYRTNLQISEPIEFSAGWEARLLEAASHEGAWGHHSAIDLFVFPKSLFQKLPPLIAGRAWFDQWLIKSARKRGIPVVDVSAATRIIHQNHDYSHVEGGLQWAYHGEEARTNLDFYGERPHTYTLLNVTHELTTGGTLKGVFLRRSLFQVENFLWKMFVQKTFPLRKRLGLQRGGWRGKAKSSSSSVSEG